MGRREGEGGRLGLNKGGMGEWRRFFLQGGGEGEEGVFFMVSREGWGGVVVVFFGTKERVVGMICFLGGEEGGVFLGREGGGGWERWGSGSKKKQCLRLIQPCSALTPPPHGVRITHPPESHFIMT